MNIKLHAHQMHNNNCWGINCTIVPTPMVLQLWPEGAEPGSGVQRFVMAANWQRGFEVKILYFEIVTRTTS